MSEAERDRREGVPSGVGPAAVPHPSRPRRFFKEASVVARQADFEIRLDGKAAKTPARRDLALPTRAAAEAVAAEWNGLGDIIDPKAMPLTRIVNAAIDGVVSQADAVKAEIVNYVGSDLLFYRAAEPERLVAEQARVWDPLLVWCRERFEARFFLVEGIMHVEQPAEALALMAEAVELAVGQGSGAPFRLAALNVMTTLTGSALLALAVMYGRLDVAGAWSAAHLDETFQEASWGKDEEATERRRLRQTEMEAAAALASLV